MNLSNPQRRPPRILLISPLFMPVETAEAIVNGKLVIEFLRAGWQVDVLTRANRLRAGELYGEAAWKEPWLGIKDSVTQLESGLEPLVSASRKMLEKPLPRAYTLLRRSAEISWARGAARWAMRRHRQQAYDVVLSRSLPEVAHLAAMWFSRKSGVPWIANWNDPTASKTPQPYGGGPDAPLSRMGRRMLRSVGLAAAWHTFPSEPLRQYIVGYMPVDISAKSSVMPHVAVRLVAPKPHDTSRSMVICHNGDLRLPRDAEPFFAGLAKFVKKSAEHPRVEVVICGMTDDHAHRSAARHSVESIVKILGPRTYLQSQEILAQADVAVVVEAPCKQAVFLPSKLVDYVTLARPTIAMTSPDSAVAQLLNQHGGGAIAPCGDADAVAAVLSRMYASWNAGTLEKDFDTSCLYELFSPTTILARYQALFENLGVAHRPE